MPKLYIYIYMQVLNRVMIFLENGKTMFC